MKRGGPLRVDPVKVREWRDRSAQRAMARQREKDPQTKSRNVNSRRSRPRNDAAWRAQCVEAYGEWCRECGTSRDVQMDHVWPRGQGGPSDVRNGLPLCRSHHEAKTAGTLQIRPEWLTEEQRLFLADHVWVAWGVDGYPSGLGWKHFAPWRWATGETGRWTNGQAGE